jgi:DNA-binding IclR family transcriptional regulator
MTSTKAPRGIQSATVGLRVLKVLADAAGPLHLREIAAAADMDTSNVYRYLVSFGEAALVVQQADTRYDLGPFALEIGLAALRRIDGLDLAIQALNKLVAKIDLDGHVSVFGSAGPTVVRWRGRVHDVVVRVSEGTILAPLTSASGRAWGAFIEPERFEQALQTDLSRTSASEADRKWRRSIFEQQIAEVRRTGLSLSCGERRMGVDALSTPIFDRDGSIAFVITLLGPPETFDPGLTNAPAFALRQTAVELSHALGADSTVMLRYPWIAKASSEPSAAADSTFRPDPKIASRPAPAPKARARPLRSS